MIRQSIGIFTATFILISGAVCAAEEVVIFDGLKNIGKPVGDFTREDDGISTTAKFVEFEGHWDLSKNLDIKFDVENTSPDRPMNLKLEIYDASAQSKSETQTNHFNLPPATRRTFVFKHPRPPAHPEVAEKIFGMRASPFGGGDKMTLPEDYSNILRARIQRHWSSPRAALKIRNITAVEHNPADTPAWFAMTEGEFFPFVDKYGQFKFKEWKGKTHSDAELKAAALREEKELAAHPRPADRDKFGGWTAGGRLEATGHFRTEKIGGKWWLVDPDGNLFWSHGVVRVLASSAMTPLDGREFYFENLPSGNDRFAEFYTTRDELLVPHYQKRGIKRTYDFSAANLYRKYGENWREKFAQSAHRRLASWGLNTIANGSDRNIFMMDKTPYVDRFEVGGRALAGSDGMWWPFRDPYSESFAADLRKKLAERRAELQDPWCIGFFVDNELHWGDEFYLAKCVLQSPADMPAKKVFAQCLKDKYGDIGKLNAAWKTSYANWGDFLTQTAVPEKADKGDLTEFSRRVAEKYFEVVRFEMMAVAPKKLYLGCRFAGVNQLVLRAAAKYCDAMSFNIYSDSVRDFKLPDGIDKPVIIGEWHFGATDRGLFHPTLCMCEDQNARAAAYYNYAKSALENPAIIGIHWHQFSDQAVTGRFDGENFQVGLTDVCDNPYPETIAKVREVGRDMYKIRGGGNPTRK